MQRIFTEKTSTPIRSFAENEPVASIRHGALNDRFDFSTAPGPSLPVRIADNIQTSILTHVIAAACVGFTVVTLIVGIS